jgi:hypothetical protein
MRLHTYNHLSKALLLIFIEAIVNGIVFLIHLSAYSLLVYKRATDFYLLILYLTSLLKLVIRSSFFFFGVESLGSFKYTIMSFINWDNLISSFLTWMPFLSVCLIALARTSSAILNKSEENGHPCPDFRESYFSSPPHLVCHM